MTSKRARKTRAEAPETEDVPSVFYGLDGSEGREPQEDALPDGLPETPGAPEDVFGGLVGSDIEAVPGSDPPAYAPPSGTVDEYVRRQVLLDLYGTEHPSEHDRISLAIKKYL